MTVMVVNGAVNFRSLCVVSTRATREDEYKGGGKCEPCHQRCCDCPSEKEHIGAEQPIHITANETNESDDHNQRAGSSFTQRQTINHPRWR